ncbi:MAG: SBBP repeat-containing protein [Candidatus Binatia bacterium]
MSPRTLPGAPMPWRLAALVISVIVIAGARTPAFAACGSSPHAGCIVPANGLVVVKEASAGRERLKLVLKNMPSSVGRQQLGDPATGTTRYDVCIYDGTAALAGALSVDRAAQLCGEAGKPCWLAMSDKGYRYRDVDGTAAGVQKIVALGGPAGSGKLSVKAGNSVAKQQTAMPTGLTTRLEGARQVTVQIVTSDGACFGGTLTRVLRAGATLLAAAGTVSESPTTSTTSTTRPTTTSTSTSTTTTTTRPTTTSTSTSTTSTTTTLPSGSATWARDIGTTNSDSGYDVAVDGGGNVFVAGAFRGSVNFGGTTRTSAGGADWFLAKYSPTNVLAWVRAMGGTGDDSPASVVVDGNGDVVVAGHFAGTASFGGAALVASGTSDIALAKYNGADGTHQWSKRFGGAYDDGAAGVAVDGGGNIVLTGFFQGTVDFGTGVLRVPFDTDLDVFLTKFTSAGTVVWATNFPNTGNDRGYGIAVDSAGSIAITGYFSNTIDFGGAQFSSANGLIDVFVAKFTASGAHLWSRQIGAPDGNEGGNAITMDGGGNVLVTGYAIEAVNFGGGLLDALGGADVFVAKYTAASGAHLWSRRLGGSGNDYCYGVAVDATGNVAVAGSFERTGAFGDTSLTAAGAGDAFVAKYTATGAPVWARQLGGTSSDIGQGVAFAPSGHPFTTGYFYGTGSFGGTTLTSAGVADAFLVRLAP